MRTGRLLLFAGLLSSPAYGQGSPITQVIEDVLPVINGVTDISGRQVENRRLGVLVLTPDLLKFSRLGQTQQVAVDSVLTDMSAYDVTASHKQTTYSVDTPSIASVGPDGMVTALTEGITVLNAFHLGRQTRAIIVVDPSIGMDSLALTPAQLQFDRIGSQLQLQVMGTFIDGVTIDVTRQAGTVFSNNDPGVVHVSTSGLVTARAGGPATITVSNATAISSASVFVSIPPGNEVTRLEAATSKPVIRAVNSSAQLTVDAVLRNGSRVFLGNSAAGTTYQTSAATVAVVSSEGTVTAVGNGAARITVTNSGVSTVVVQVVSFSSLLGVSIDPPGGSVSINSMVGPATKNLAVRANYSDGTSDNVTASAEYSSSDQGLATVSSDGFVAFAQPGSVRIGVSVEGKNGEADFQISRFVPSGLGSLAGDFTNVAALGSLAVAVSEESLHTVDATSAGNPIIIGTASAFGPMRDVAVAGHRAYVAETTGLAIFDLLDPTRPSRVSTLAGTNVRGVAVGDGYLYFSDGSSFRIHDAASLAELGRLDGLPSVGEAIAVSSGLAFIAGGTGGVHIIDVSAPAMPILQATIQTPAPVLDIAAVGRRAFVTGQDALLEIDATVPGEAGITAQSSQRSPMSGVAAREYFVFSPIPVSNDPLIFNVSQPKSLAFVGSIDLPGFGSDARIAVSESLLYQVVRGPSPRLSVGIYKPDDPPSPPIVSLLSPVHGLKVVEGSLVQVAASATDNFGVSQVTYFVDGVAQAVATLPPYGATVSIPFGSSGRIVRVGAQARDLSGLLSPMAEVLVESAPDPLTTVQGRLVTVFGDPVTNAQVTVAGQLPVTTGLDGGFILSHVPTQHPSITVTSTATVEGFTIYADVRRPPVLGGGTNFGDIVMGGNISLAGNVSGTLVPILGPYKMTGDATVPLGQTLTLPAGTILKFAGGRSLTVQGALAANGNSARRVWFTSLADDSVGGDTGADGPTSGAPGQWAGLIFQNAAAATLVSSATVRYAAEGAAVTAGSARFEDTVFSSASVAAIRLERGANVMGARNRALGNLLNGIDVMNGSYNSTTSVWDDVGIPFVVRRGVVDLNHAATLTVGSGVVVKLRGNASTRGEIVGGGRYLRAQGQPGRPVVFTSLLDDSFGGDTNNDGADSAPAPGDWHRIALSGSEASSLEHVVVRYGGADIAMVQSAEAGGPAMLADFDISSSAAAGVEAQGSMTLSDGMISANGGAAGLLLTAVANATATAVHFARNTSHGVQQVDATRLRLEQSQFTGNGGYGVVAFNNNSGRGSPLALSLSTATFVGNGGVIRMSPAVLGISVTGDVFMSGTGLQGVDVQAGSIIGTPRTWPGLPIPYIVRGGEVVLRQDLTLGPGAAVKLGGAPAMTGAFGVLTGGGPIAKFSGQEGALIAQGTAERPVIFTSLKDDSVLGDTNGDGAATSPAPGDWHNLGLGGNNPNVLTNALIRYGGSTINGTVLDQLDSSQPMILTNVDISSGAGGGLTTQSGLVMAGGSVSFNKGSKAVNLFNTANATMTGVQFAGNIGHAVQTDNDAQLSLGDVAFAFNGGHGLFMNNALAVKVATASFTGNGGTARMHPSVRSLRMSGAVTASGNALNGVEVPAGQIFSSPRTWSALPFAYVIRGGPVGARQNLTLEAGVVVKLLGSSSRLEGQEGTIFAFGEAGKPVVFTSLKDDSVLGDTNADGASTLPAPGDWQGVNLVGGATNDVRHTLVRYAGAAGASAVTVSNHSRAHKLEVSQSLGVGLDVNENVNVAIGSSTLTANAIGARAGLSLSFTISQSTIAGNSSFGVQRNGGSTIDARDNWWGSITGPQHASNPTGAGDRVSNGVTFIPFLTAAPE